MKLTKRLIDALKTYAENCSIDVQCWTQRTPHFGGHAPHNYQAFASEYVATETDQKVCVYCLKPESHKE